MLSNTQQITKHCFHSCKINSQAWYLALLCCKKLHCISHALNIGLKEKKSIKEIKYSQPPSNNKNQCCVIRYLRSRFIFNINLDSSFMVIDFFILKLSKTIISNDYLLFSKFLKELILWRLWVVFFHSLSFSGMSFHHWNNY